MGYIKFVWHKKGAATVEVRGKQLHMAPIVPVRAFREVEGRGARNLLVGASN